MQTAQSKKHRQNQVDTTKLPRRMVFRTQAANVESWWVLNDALLPSLYLFFLNLMTLRCPFGSHYSLSHSLSRLVFASGAQFSLRVQFLQSRQGLVSKMKGSPVAQHSPTIGSIGSSSQPLIGGLSSGTNGNQARATPVDHVGSILWGANCCISQPFIWHLSTCQPSAASASSCDQN